MLSHNTMTYTTTLKKVGNSRAFIIPAKILKKHNLKEGSTVLFEEKGHSIELHFSPGPVSFFSPLNEAAKRPGPAINMDDIRNDRVNKEEVVW